MWPEVVEQLLSLSARSILLVFQTPFLLRPRPARVSTTLIHSLPSRCRFIRTTTGSCRKKTSELPGCRFTADEKIGLIQGACVRASAASGVFWVAVEAKESCSTPGNFVSLSPVPPPETFWKLETSSLFYFFLPSLSLKGHFSGQRRWRFASVAALSLSEDSPRR